jgi:O-antigen ligase
VYNGCMGIRQPIERFKIPQLLKNTPPAVAIAVAAAGLLPLAFNPWGYHAFELPKAVLLQALGLLAASAALVALAGSRQRPPWKLPLVIPVTLFGLALLLSTLLSTDRQLSLWGSYERQQGLLTQAGVLLLFLATAVSLRTRAQVSLLWSGLVWASAPVVAYGLLQAAGLDPFAWQTDAASPLTATLGRANFVATYLVLVLPLTLARFLTASRRWPYALLMAAQLLLLALTLTRSAWIGLGVAALASAVLWAVVVRNRRLLFAGVLLAVAALGLLLIVSLPAGPLSSLGQLPGLDRLSQLGDLDSGSTAARWAIWRTSLPLTMARPWTGYGPDTMRLVFAQSFPPELIYYQGRHLGVDRAHNLWLDLGLSSGLAGLATFGLVLLAFGRLAWRQLVRASSRRRQIAWMALAAAVAGHLVDMQFSFDTAATSAVFWLILALAVGLYRSEQVGTGASSEPTETEAVSARRVLLPYLPPLAALLALSALMVWHPLAADSAFRQAVDPQIPAAERLEAGQRAIELWPGEPTYRLGLASVEGGLGRFTAAEERFAAASRIRPADPLIWAAWGEMYAHWGQHEPSRLRQAQAAYERALSLAPNTATYHTALGLILAQQGQVEAGAAEIQRALDLDTTDVTAYTHLARVFDSLGQGEKAAWARQEAVYWSEQTQTD